jgi:tetratricopeptide (TPR) repeat protein
VEAVLAWLNSNPGWLLILDNVDTHSAADVADRLMGRIEGGRVLLTSRLTEFPLSVDPLDLGMLALPDAAALLLEGSAAGRPVAPDDTAQAEALAEALGRLALALTMAAATMRARQLSFAQYRAIWGNNRSRVIGWAKPEITGYHHAVAETWRTSVDQLSGSGRHLLELLAFLAPDPVPAFLLDLPVPNVAFEDSHAALDNLATYSLATRDPDGDTSLVHRLLQDVTRRGLAEAGVATARLIEALGWVDGALAGHPEGVRTWGRLDPLAPHADAVAAHGDAAGIAVPTARIMGELAILFRGKALYARAEPFYRRALAIDEASLGEDHPTVAIRLGNLAQSLQATNRLREAESLMRRALAIKRQATTRTIQTSRPASTTLPDCSEPPTSSARRSRSCGERSPLLRQASAETIRTLRPPSTTSQRCCEPRTGSAKRNRLCAARSPSPRQASARTIRQLRSGSTTSAC